MRVDIGDVRLFVDFEGSGWPAEELSLHERPVVVLVHGGPGTNDHSHYKPAFSALADVAQLVYYDHRGHGRSDKSDPRKWNLAQWADDLRALCEALDIRRPIVLGTSFGGFVVQSYLIRHPGHASKAVLCSTSSRFCFSRTLATMLRLGGPQAREAAERFWCGPDAATDATFKDYLEVCSPLYLRSMSVPTREVTAISTRTRKNLEVMRHFTGPDGEAHRFNFLPALGTVECPTLVLAGEDDPITTIEDAVETAAALPVSLRRFERFPHCGHPTYSDAPTRTFRLLRNFIAQQVE